MPPPSPQSEKKASTDSYSLLCSKCQDGFEGSGVGSVVLTT